MVRFHRHGGEQVQAPGDQGLTPGLVVDLTVAAMLTGENDGPLIEKITRMQDVLGQQEIGTPYLVAAAATHEVPGRESAHGGIIGLAMALEAAAQRIETVPGTPVLELSHYSVQAGLTSPDSSLVLDRGNNPNPWTTAMWGTIACDSVLSGEMALDGFMGITEYGVTKPESFTFIVHSEVNTNDTYDAAEVTAARFMDRGALVVGSEAVRHVLTALTEKELAPSERSDKQHQFEASTGLLAIAMLKNLGFEWAVEEPDERQAAVQEKIHEAGLAVIAQVVADSLKAESAGWPLDTQKLARRLSACEFTSDDAAVVRQQVVESLDDNDRVAGIRMLAGLNGVDDDAYVAASVDNFFSHVLGL